MKMLKWIGKGISWIWKGIGWILVGILLLPIYFYQKCIFQLIENVGREQAPALR